MRPLPFPELTVASVEALVFRYPLTTPVRTSFGTMLDRPAVLVRVTAQDGAQGWGEIWCNFPACGAEHRARLLDSVMAPLLEGKTFKGPQEAFARLTSATEILAIQSGEPGPIAQVIAGIDLALWDLCARRAATPLWNYLGGQDGRIPVYASGINPGNPAQVVLEQRARGHKAFKLKIGFGAEIDIPNVEAVRRLLRPGESLMADANQAWQLDQALQMKDLLTPYGLRWLEEPLAANQPWSSWKQLGERVAIPLAAGENIRGNEDFLSAIGSGALSVIQPDAAKWGGVSGNWPVIRAIGAAGLQFCPHYLGGGVGLLASGHLLAAAGGGGMLEVDSNPNPLRSLLSPVMETIDQGQIDLGKHPGIGPEPDYAALKTMAVNYRE